MRPLLILTVMALGCGEEIETIRISLRAPQALDPSQVASVVIAAVHEPTSSCVSSVGSNQCATLKTVAEASKASGYIKQITLTPTGGSTGFVDELPFGRTCFVAEALSANLTSLASGCAEVSLKLEKHKVEIELQ